MSNDRLYQLALTLVPHVGDVHAKALLQHFGSAEAIFRASRKELQATGIGTARTAAIKAFTDFGRAEQELRFVEKHGIRLLCLTDTDYPQRLLHCNDSPALLFFKGTADLNAPRVLSVVGTRKNTDYGRQFTEGLIGELAAHGVTIISGLAYGIDAIAHRAALRHHLPTVGVVGHGLDRIYPPAHSALAREMVEGGGGLLSEFFSQTEPDKHHFPLRNRVVAGLSDATLVIETDRKGGSMITAKLADSYNRDVFALPGRVTDKASSGCNYLIQHNKALLLSGAGELLTALGWKPRPQKPAAQRQLFIELSPEEQHLLALLQEKEAVHIDELHLRSSLSSSSMAAAILSLELQNIITALPGKMYKLV